MTDQTMTHEQEQGAWPHLTKMIREYIDDYHLEGDEGSYTPTRRERFIAEDIINSMLVDDEMADVIRAALSRPTDTEASRTLDALIALAAGDEGLPDDLRADVERLRARVVAAGVSRQLTTEQPERLLAKHQPCGCVICDCEDDHQCQGCGAKSCGTHPVQEIPNPVYVEQEQPEDGPVFVVTAQGRGARRSIVDHEKGALTFGDKLYPEAVKAERDALRAELIKLEQRDFQELTRANERIAELEAQVRTEAPAELVELLDRLSPPGHGIALKGDPTQTFHTGHDVYLAQRVRAWLATHESRLRGEGE